jgi:hypothetical protein
VGKRVALDIEFETEEEGFELILPKDNEELVRKIEEAIRKLPYDIDYVDAEVVNE